MVDITNIDRDDHFDSDTAEPEYADRWTIASRTTFILLAALVSWGIVIGLGYGVARLM